MTPSPLPPTAPVTSSSASSPSGVHGGARLCGHGRTAGEVYVECGPRISGIPLRDLLVDLPQLVDAEEWGVSPIGMKAFQLDGVTHLLDWVGESHYPEVADFIEEAVRGGLSRKVSHTGPIGELTSESCLYLLHPRALITNAAALPAPAGFTCPCGKGHVPAQGCLGWAWHAEPNVSVDPDAPGGPARRRLAQGAAYPVMTPSVPRHAEYALALFLVAPITNLTVIQSPDAATMAERLAAAQKSGIPVFIADE